MKNILILLLSSTLILSCSNEETQNKSFTYSVNVNPIDGGDVSVTMGEAINGTIILITATPAPDFEFLNWSGDDTGTTNPISIIMDRNKNITANFAIKDDDKDGVSNTIDICPNTPYGVAVNLSGCSESYQSSIEFNSNLTYGSISDINGYTYKTIQIGTQLWMAENLKSISYRNGERMHNVSEIYYEDYGEYSSVGTYSNYVYSGTDKVVDVATYGRLYNWSAVSDSRGLCPEGWRVPNDNDWTILTNYLGGLSWAGGRLKEKGLVHWSSPNEEGSNNSGFTGLPGGTRELNGRYRNIFSTGYWWSTTENGDNNAYIWVLDYYRKNVQTVFRDKRSSMCVRCIKE